MNLDFFLTRFHFASRHQGDDFYGRYGGTQCTGNCLAALVYASTVSPEHWTTDDLDHILDLGIAMYTELRQKMEDANGYGGCRGFYDFQTNGPFKVSSKTVRFRSIESTRAFFARFQIIQLSC